MNLYDDGNIPEIDVPQNIDITEVDIPAPYPINSTESQIEDRIVTPVEPLPESTLRNNRKYATRIFYYCKLRTKGSIIFEPFVPNYKHHTL